MVIGTVFAHLKTFVFCKPSGWESKNGKHVVLLSFSFGFSTQGFFV